MAMVKPNEGWKNKLKYRDELYKGNDEQKKKEILQAINFHSVRFMQLLQSRKAFINNHPKKIEIAMYQSFKNGLWGNKVPSLVVDKDTADRFLTAAESIITKAVEVPRDLSTLIRM